MTMFKIKKIEHIETFGSFSGFDWDSSVRDEDDKLVEFNKVNILYGRNYSGKTTLSRIFRALEKGELPANYKKIDFTLEDAERKKITAKSLDGYSDNVRVFNTDFVKENLQFIYDEENGIIKSFSVALGKDTADDGKQLADVKSKLGLVDDGKGFLWSAATAKGDRDKAYKNNENAENNLKTYKTNLARHVRHNPAKYGDPDYQAGPKLEKDINAVTSPSYSPLNQATKRKYEQLIEEKGKQPIQLPNSLDVNFDELAQKVEKLVEQKVLTQVPIDELVDAPALADWAERGMDLHAKRETCGFCRNHLTEKIWDDLKNHFNQESQDLKGNIESLLATLDGEVDGVKKYSGKSEFANENYYSHFHASLDDTRNNYENEVAKYSLAIDKLKEQLADKASAVSREIDFQKPNFDASQLIEVAEQLRQMTVDLNIYSAKLADDQQIARGFLRCDYVSSQIQPKEYQKNVEAFAETSRAYKSAKQDYENKQELVDENKQTMRELQTRLSNESAGADKVNELLAVHFAKHSFSLASVENDSQTDGENNLGGQNRFVIKRGAEIAYNLSEGERNLVAFCYFVARLNEGDATDDDDTAKQRPIIWIDDPVSSLDSNHIFFVYSLIRSQIWKANCAAQLFISTHNLTFLKYLTQMNGPNSKFSYFLVERPQGNSVVTVMPDHLTNATEFNYLFKQIYICANADISDEKFIQNFLDFGNNARKFLEIFLYYCYPNTTSFNAKLGKFFEENEGVMESLTARLMHQRSHIAEQMEKGMDLFDLSAFEEMQRVAKCILQKIKSRNGVQYNEFLESIGEQPED